MLRPVIDFFFDSLSFRPTTINYVSTTSAAGADTYRDDDVTEANTKLLAVPLMVVQSTGTPDASGTGNANVRTYSYHSMRQDPFGRGPLGFHRVQVFDQASQVKTVTTYAQAYPFTGMPIEVDKYQDIFLPHFGAYISHLTNKTTTEYCLTSSTDPEGSEPFCGPLDGGQFPAGARSSPTPAR